MTGPRLAPRTGLSASLMLVLFVTVALVLQIVLGSAPVALAINVAFLAGYLTTRGWDLLVHWRGFQ